MNPELLRNVWLELTPRRILQMGVVLALILLTANVTPFINAADVAQYLFYAIVVLWGTRNAGQAVVGEIRERTWDFQRLSALTPFEMTWGKLLGATSYVWLGGLICLLVILVSDVREGSPRVLQHLFYYSAIGLFTQAVALFASLIAIRRRQTRTQFNVFQYQAVGVLAGFFALQAWRTVTGGIALQSVTWWGETVHGETFYLASLAVFLAWALIGCYRLMRVELQLQNTPVVWLVFILFMAFYMAGFGNLSFLAQLPFISDVPPLRLAVAHATLVILTYIAILFEPKDRVLYRWLGEMLAKGRTAAVLSRLQCWMISYAAAMISGFALAHELSVAGSATRAVLNEPMAIAGLGFLTRDVGIFLCFGLGPGQKRGDMPAVITLGVLYLLLPILFGAAGVVEPAALFYPVPGSGWVGAIFAWVEAAVIWFLLVSVRAKQTAALPQT